MQQLANDPSFVVQFAVGDPIPNLVPQSKGSGIRMSGAYFDQTKRYIMKKAHMSKEDVRAPPPPPPRDVSIDLCYLFFLSNYECNSLFLSVLMLFDTTKVRIFDVASGQVILVSHHPGKNPYDKLDPLGLGNTDAQHAVHGGEWESATDVTSRHHSMPSFKIRPKSLSSHGRQFIKSMHGQ